MENFSKTQEFQIFKEFAAREDEYLTKLNRLVEYHLPRVPKHLIIDVFEVFGRIDLIYIHHKYQFCADFYTADSVHDIVENFIKHRYMFFMYKDFLRVEPYLIWLKQEFTEFEFVKRLIGPSSNSITNQRFGEYLVFLNNVKSANICSSERCDIAIRIIQDVVTGVSDDEKNQQVRLSEFLLSEKKYNINLKQNLQLYSNIVFSNTNEYDWNKPSLYGKLPQIYQAQTLFFQDLDNYRYDMDVDDFITCFLNHKSMFELYKEDRKLRSRRVRDKCAAKYKEFCTIKDIIFDRLFKYPQFLDVFQKCFKDDKTHNKIKDVLNMLTTIISEINDVVAVNEITDANIDIYSQGKLLLRGDIKVSGLGDVTLFLFQKALVFTKISKKNEQEYYVYDSHVLATNIMLGVEDGEFFHHKSMSADVRYTLTGKKDVVDTWNTALRDLIMSQVETYKCI